MNTRKVLLLNSGGADSYATAIVLKNAGYEIVSLFIDYGQPAHYMELNASIQMHHLLEIPFFDKHHFNRKLPMDSFFEEDAKEVDNQEIFLRNFVLMSYACQLAYNLNIANIATGYCSMQDVINYVDDNPCFLQDFHKMTLDYFGIRLMTPIAGFNKDMVWATLLSQGIDPLTLPYCNTPVMRDEIYYPCGDCHKCKLTTEALPKLKGDLEWTHE